MPERWTGEVMKELHLNRLTCKDLARKMEIREGYLSEILNGKRSPKRAEERVMAALQELIEERRNNDTEADGCYPGIAAEN